MTSTKPEPAPQCCRRCDQPIDERDLYCRHCGEPQRRPHRIDRDRIPSVWFFLLLVLALVILAFIAGLLVDHDDSATTGSRVLVCSTRARNSRCSETASGSRAPFILAGGAGALVTNCSDVALPSNIKQLCAAELSNHTNVQITVVEQPTVPATTSTTTPTTPSTGTPQTPVTAVPNLAG
jgi:hypothetical protein